MRCFLMLFFMLLLSGSYAQSYRVDFMLADSTQTAPSLKTRFKNQPEAALYLQSLTRNLLVQGYLAASLDSVFYDSTQAMVWLFTGKKYYWSKLELPDGIAGYREKSKSRPGKPGSTAGFDAIEGLQNQLLADYANRGYPFASVSFGDIQLVGDSISGRLVVDPGSFYALDSISLIGGLRLKPGFLYPYFQVKKGMPYNQSLLGFANQRLLELPFAESIQAAEMVMLGSGAHLKLAVKPRRSNIINALLGFMPASTQTPSNKLLITGEANLLLRNSFALGETIGINWQQIQYKSPRLEMLYQQQYLFGSLAGIDFRFEMFKKDSQFVNLQVQVGTPFEWKRNQSGKVFFHHQSTQVSFIDTQFIKSSRILPDLAGSSISSLGLSYFWNTTDYRQNPRTGFEGSFTGSGGLKKINRDERIVQLKDDRDMAFRFVSLYDSVRLKTFQLRLEANAGYYLPAGRQSVIKLALQAGWLQSDNYFRNELFQIGGNRLLRGFDEESIFARNYLVATTEYRFLTGRNSYLLAFANGGFAGFKNQQVKQAHGYIGAGLGLVLEAKNNLIRLSLANGKRNDLPFNLRQSKIHIGVVNFF